MKISLHFVKLPKFGIYVARLSKTIVHYCISTSITDNLGTAEQDILPTGPMYVTSFVDCLDDRLSYTIFRLFIPFWLSTVYLFFIYIFSFKIYFS